LKNDARIKLLTLQQRNELSALLFDVIRDALFVLNSKGEIVEVNNAACSLYQYDYDELIGLHGYDLISDSYQCLFDQFIEKVSKGESFIVHSKDIKKNGDIFDAEIKGLPFIFHGNQLLLAIVRDVSDRDRAIETNQANLKKFRRLIQHIPDVVWTRNQCGKILFVTENIENAFGFKSEELYQNESLWFNRIHPEDIEKVKNAFENLFTQNTSFDIEYRLQTKDGKWIWVNDRSTNIYKQQDTLVADGIITEITHRKKIETELREAKESFETLFNTMADPVMILDKKGKFIELTDKVKEYTGFEKSEILGKNFLKTKLLTSKSKAICIKNLVKRMAGVSVDPYEVEALTKDGRKIPFEVNAEKIMYKGEPADLVVFRDISSRVETEKRLRQSEKTYRNLFQNAQVGLFRTNLEDGQILECNNQLAYMFGFKSRNEFIKKYRIEKFYVHPDDRSELVDKLKEREYVDHFEAAFYRKNKSVFWARYTAKLDREHGWVEGVFEDITELKKAEDKLRKKHEQLKSEQQQLLSIFDSINHAIYVADPKTYEILYTNSKLRRSLKKDATGKKCYEVLQNKSSPCGFCTNDIILKNKGKPYKWEYQNPFTKKDYELTDKIITWPDGRNVRMELAVDITDRKKAMEEIKRAHHTISAFNRELEKKVNEKTERIENLLQQKDEFINQLGHDLKHPLGPLVNLLPLIENHIADEKYKEMIQVARRNVEYMRNLVVKTVELAKLNSPNTKFIFEHIKLFPFVENVLESNKYLSERKKIQIHNLISKDFVISADQLRLEELFTNLITNAIKYTKVGGSVFIKAEEIKENVIISVSDDGIGMSEEQLVHLFDEFYKADESRHDFESSGLGLSICKRIVERHGGDIWVESPGIDRGSTVHIRLPKTMEKTGENEHNQPIEKMDDEGIRQKIDDLIEQ
jgi:PAS domain S-box-containing protein